MIDVDKCHELFRDEIKQKLAFSGQVPFGEWKEKLKKKFSELTGLSEIEKNGCSLGVVMEYVREEDGCKRIRFTFESERGMTVPGYLLVPAAGKKKYPLAITLQGHSTGFHNSIGEIKYPQDEEYQPRGAFALQAVRRGFAALAIEQRGMGEQKSSLTHGQNCQHVFATALLLGRTIVGERVWDIHRAIDAVLSSFDFVDGTKIMVTGNSGGGTAAYYAACYDDRIGLCVPGCSFCPYRESILSRWHCGCNYIPDAYRWFEMQDLAGLIAPRSLAVIAGQKDEDFPIAGVRRGYKTVESIYSAVGARGNCRLIETPMGHWWCEEIVWKTVAEEMKRLGW